VTDVAARPAFRIRRLDLATATPDERRALVRRSAVPDPAVRDGVRAILADVRARGWAAVREANERYGGGRADGAPVVPAAEIAAAGDALPAKLQSAFEQMIANLTTVSRDQLPATTRTEVASGIEIERRWTPLARVGAYAPGGSAAYPSSLVMCVVPARVAGVGEIVVATPAAADGSVDRVLLGAAALLGVDKIVVAGGAQAVAALAYGVPEAGIEPVDRIVGPGNAWVTAAKLEVFGEVGIDLPAGPSEVMVLADATADPRHVAADLLSQAEHGPDSPAILVTFDEDLADAFEREIAAQLAGAARQSVLERSLGAAALIVLTPDRDAAIEFVDAYAAEHLTVVVDDPDEAVRRIRSAGSLFVGPWAPESAGDYASGANHVLPTGGLARSSGPLSVDAFGRYTQVQRIDREGLAAIRATVGAIATAEGLHAHREAVEVRFRDGAA
jgi:histidinol dehydrogenase